MNIFFFHRIRALILKEFQVLVTEPQSRRLLLLPVILQIALYPFAASLEVKNKTLGIYNQDAGLLSTDLTQRFTAAKAFNKIVVIHDDRELRRVIDHQEALLVIRFPQDFSRHLHQGTAAPLQAILDGRRSNSAQIVLYDIQQIIDQWSRERQLAAGVSPPSQIIIRNWFNPNLNYQWFILPSLVAMILTIGVLVVTSLSIAREREQGTLDQLLVSPLTPEMIMIGKAVPAMLIATFQATLVLLAAIYLYHVPFEGSLILFYGSIICYALALVGFGLLISSVCETQQQAFLGVFCFLMPGVLLSGFASPIDNMPHWLQIVTWFNPLRHFMVISKSIFLKKIGFVFLLEQLWPLLCIAVITISGAITIFRRRIR